ncbi:MAG: hypothetical protein GZ089_02140 [Aromatoleum sp.]|nr:hypothetical protein [Aromatoleum sp.]
MKRAQEAESKADETRQMAERARGEAEKLIVYLLDDFYLELEPVGRLDIVAELAKRALDYYHELPPQLRTAETDRNRALALVRYGAVLRYQSKLDEGGKALSEAIDILGRLRMAGDQSEVTTIGLALGLAAQARIADSLNKSVESVQLADQAAAVLGPLMATSLPSIPLLRAYGSVMNYVGFSQLRSNDPELAVKSLEAAREAYRSIDGLTLVDLSAAAGYAEAAAWQMEALRNLDRLADARRNGEEAARIAGQILEKRPAHMGALRARGLILSNLADIESDGMRLRHSLVLGEEATRDWENFLKLDPGNAIAWNNLAANHLRNALGLYGLGRLGESREKYLAASAVERRTKMSAFLAVNLMFPAGRLAALEADLGNRPQAEAALADVHRLAEIPRATLPASSAQAASLQMLETGFRIAIPVAAGDDRAVRRMVQAAIPDGNVVKPTGGRAVFIWNFNMATLHRALADADYNLKEYAEAEQDLRQSIGYQRKLPEHTLERRRQAAQDQVLLAMILARLDRRPEAQQLIAPALQFQRDLLTRGNEDLTVRIELAQALYASALAGGAQSSASLTEAAALIDGLPLAMRGLKSSARLRGWIAEEQKSPRG